MRRFALDEIERRTFDLAIIGGGVTGASAAREAALRGLSVALVEKNDFASGTSSRSTKLLHGGLRYLESHEFKLVREACRERELMLKLAPHLSNVRPFIYVLYQGYPESMRLLAAGLSIYDLFSGNPLKRRHRMLSPPALLDVEPHLNAEQSSRRRALLRLPHRRRALHDRHAEGRGRRRSARSRTTWRSPGWSQDDGKIRGIEVADRITGETGVVRARQVINTAGPWVDTVRFLEDGVGERLLRPTKGVHIVVRKQDFPLQHAVFVRSPRDNRVVWPIPALDEELVYIGTTDTDYDGPLDHVTATDDDIDYLLEVANFTIPEAALDRRHIVATWAGLRPLIAPEGSMAASSVSREQQIVTSPRGLLTIAGGKLTTARVMGRQVIDAAIELLADELRDPRRPAIAQRLGPDQRRRPGRALPGPPAPRRAADRAGRARPLARLRRQCTSACRHR